MQLNTYDRTVLRPYATTQLPYVQDKEPARTLGMLNVDGQK